MKNLEKTFTGTCVLLGVLALTLLFSGYIDFGTSLSSLVLLVTAMVIGKQAFATERMVEYQSIPSIEMFLIRHRGGGHCFAFYNLSSVPGKITFGLSFQQSDSSPVMNYKNDSISYRIPPQGRLITATTFFANDDLPKEIELKKGLVVGIDAVIVPNLDGVGADTKRTYKKSYRFQDEEHETLDDKRWDEASIGFPDISLFHPENSGLRESVEFIKREYMEKNTTGRQRPGL